MTFVFSVIAIIFIILGVLISKYKAYWLISGYNTMSKDKKENVDIEGLSKFVGNFMYLTAGILLAGVFLPYVGVAYANVITIFLMCLNIIALLVLSQRFDSNNYNEDGKLKISIKLLLGTVIIVIILIFASVFYFSRQSEIVLESDRISISGIYGEDIYYKDIVNIELDSKEPKIIKKIKGLDFRNTYKGEFKIEEVGKATLFVHSKNSYIYIYLDKEIYIINLSNINETEQLYRLIKTRM